MEEVGCFAKIYIFLFSFCTGQKPCLGKNQSNNMFFFSCNTHFFWCHFLKDVGTYRKKYNSCIYIQQRIFLLKTENSFLKRHPTIKQNIVLAFDIKCDYNLSKLLYLDTRRYLLEHHVLKIISSPKWVVNTTASKMFLEEAIFIFSWLMILKSTALWPCQLPLQWNACNVLTRSFLFFCSFGKWCVGE